jgi:CHAD domain-containing protein
MKLKPSLTAAANAHKLLPKMAEKYFHGGREAADGTRSPKQMHEFRIATKRFRYALEIFKPAYGASLDRYLKALHNLQHTLGQLSDYRSIRDMVDGDHELKEKLAHSTEKHLQEFHDQWKVFDGEGQMKRWMTYLGGVRLPVRKTRNTTKTTKTRKTRKVVAARLP